VFGNKGILRSRLAAFDEDINGFVIGLTDLNATRVSFKAGSTQMLDFLASALGVAGGVVGESVNK
jgi:hypothetical protein